LIPNSVSTLLGFLFLVTPGVSYEILRERRRPALQTSAFREAARIALWSLIFTIPAVVVLALLRPAFPNRLPDVLAWLVQGESYSDRFPSQVVTFLLAEIVVAQVLAIVAATLVGRHDRGVIRQGDIWHKVFAADCPPDREVQAMILTAKAEYRGTVVGYTTNADRDKRELELQNVHWRPNDATEMRPLPEPFDRVVIAATAILELWVNYRTEIEPPPSWWQQWKARRAHRRSLRTIKKRIRSHRRHAG
jgi:hypothetical protein